MATPAVSISNEEKLKRIVALRNRCRTDLLFLANKVLQYKDVEQEFHGPEIALLQQFNGGVDEFRENGDFVKYTPSCEPYDLEGPRRRLLLDFRGSLKTTVITITHSIQWILNYPDIRIYLFHAILDKAQQALNEIKGHFQYNENFRYLFPEYCPSKKKVNEFGNQSEFTVPNRAKKWLKEPTMQVGSVDSSTASTHVEVIKCTDLVDKENVKTAERIRQVKQAFSQMIPLLDQPYKAWIDVEGTLYDWSDLYCTILDGENSKPQEKRQYAIHRRGIMDKAGNPTWPKRFPKEAIDMIRNDPNMDTYTFMANYMNEIVAGERSHFTLDQFRWKPLEMIKGYCGRFHMTIDLSDPDPVSGPNGTEDFTVLCVSGFDRMNRINVADLSRGHYLTDEIIEEIFRLGVKWNVADIKIEDASGARRILPALRREMAKRNIWFVVSLIKRDNRVAKTDRILGLQPWFKAGEIFFAEDLPHKDQMVLEFTRLPRYSHDDIPDAIADQMQNRYTGPYEKPVEEKKNNGLPWFIPDNDEPVEEFVGYGVARIN